jgi:RNA-binding protein
LRGLAQREKPVVWLGEAGTSPGVLRSLDEALSARELVKVRMRAPADKRRTAEELAASAGAALCGLIGHTAILYRPHPVPEERLIKLPAAGGSDG